MRRRAAPASHGPAPADPLLPAVNSLVTLVAATGRSRRTRVEDVAPQWLALAPPGGEEPVEELAAPGDPFEVRWSCERGLLVLPVVLGERVVDGVPQWRLRPTGEAQLHQRRSFARAAVAGDWPVRVALTGLLPEEGSADGALVDLSEGGLRASLCGWTAPEGASVVVRLTLAEGEEGARPTGVAVTEFELLGTAVRAREQPPAAADPGADTTEVVVQLHDPGVRADDLRALVFAWQRRARRT